MCMMSSHLSFHRACKDSSIAAVLSIPISPIHIRYGTSLTLQGCPSHWNLDPILKWLDAPSAHIAPAQGIRSYYEVIDAYTFQHQLNPSGVGGSVQPDCWMTTCAL